MVGNIRFNGLVLPRDYGLSLSMKDGGKVFVSPVKYAVGRMAIDSAFKTQARIKDVCEERKENYADCLEEFKKGLKRKGYGLPTGNVLENVKRYNSSVTGKVLSRDGTTFHNVVLGNPSFGRGGNFAYDGVRCDCQDSAWGEPKRREIMCSHLSALESALFIDSHSRESCDVNLTGLKPSARFANPSMPFNLFGAEGEKLVSNMIFDYFVSGMSGFEIGKKYLGFAEIFSENLLRGIRDGGAKDSVQFNVLRQGLSNNAVSKFDEEYSGAVKSVFGRVERLLSGSGYTSSGYGLDFKGTLFETIGKRFRNGNIVYSLSVSPECPVPIVLRKILGEKSVNVLESSDKRVDFPLCRVNGTEYPTIDDATRRQSYEKVIIPWENGDKSVFAAKILKDRYNAIKGE